MEAQRRARAGIERRFRFAMCGDASKEEGDGHETPTPLRTWRIAISNLAYVLTPMANPPNPAEPPRIARLRSEIVAAIPCLPKHEAEARRELGELRFDNLLRAYLRWAYRFVPPEPRQVSFAPSFWEADVAKSHGGEILAMAHRIEEGHDLSRFLSPLLLRRGYVPRRVREQAPHEEKRWRDKDFILNALGLHHLHIANGAEEDGKLHGDELAFVEFSRDSAAFVYAGTHAEFRDPELRARLSEAVAQMRARAGVTINGFSLRSPTPHTHLMQWAKVGLSAAAAVDGKLVPHSMISTDGTPVLLVRHGDLIHGKLTELEAQLDNPEYAKEAFEQAGRPPPSSAEFQWVLRHTELDLFEITSRTLFTIVPSLQRKV
jgi:hypothetical protein